MSQRIALNRSKYALVDDADFEFIDGFDWIYASTGYARQRTSSTARKQYVYMHRLIMNAGRGQLVDHTDGDRLNNTRDNLRFVTPSENAWNRAGNREAKSGFKGVTPHPQGYQVRIRHDKRRYHLGYFKDPIYAARIYDTAALILFGQFARPNFPDERPTDELLIYVLRQLKPLPGDLP